jgi:hypothetical protein
MRRNKANDILSPSLSSGLFRQNHQGAAERPENSAPTVCAQKNPTRRSGQHFWNLSGAFSAYHTIVTFALR